MVGHGVTTTLPFTVRAWRGCSQGRELRFQGKLVRNRRCLIRSAWQQFGSLWLIIWKKGESSSESISELKSIFWKWQESTNSPFLPIPESSGRFPADVVRQRSQGGYAAGAETWRSATEKQSSQILIETFYLCHESIFQLQGALLMFCLRVWQTGRDVVLFTVFDHRHRGNAGIRERLSQLFTLMKLDVAADRMRNIQLSGYSPRFFCIHSEV